MIRLVTLLLLFATSAFGETIHLAADKWCPYNCQPKDSKPGFMVEIAQLVFARHDIKVKYEIMPWSRAIGMAQQGNIDGVIGATLDEVPQFIFPRTAQASSGTAFFVHQLETWRYNGMSSLDEALLGVIQDYDYGETLNRYIAARAGRGIDMVTGDNATLVNINKLAGRRVTTIIEDPVVLAYQTDTLNIKQRFINAGTLDAIDVYIAFSPKNPRSSAYAKMLERGMAWLRQTGQLKLVMSKYGIK